MDVPSVAYIFSNLAGMLGGIMLLVGMAAGWLDGARAPGTVWLIRSALFAGLVFAAGRYFYPRHRPVVAGRREGVAVVVLAWLLLPFIGSLPYWLSGGIPSLLDAYFEAVSGFTTCGATILTDIEGLPNGLHLWRSTTHWLGGMGIVVLFVALLPALGLRGYFLYRAEVSGPSKERIRPTTWQSALLLWGVYSFFTVVGILAYRLAGMNWFESVCHVFGGLATGGFSPKATSLGGYSPLIQLITVLIMIIGGVNFAVWARAAAGVYRRDLGLVKEAFADEEFRWFMVWMLAVPLVTFGVLQLARGGVAGNYLAGLFQTVSIATNTGYTTENFDVWPGFCRVLLFTLMFVGGCAGSTCGGIKFVRVLLALKLLRRETRLAVHPRVVEGVYLNGRGVDEELLMHTVVYVLAYLATFVIGGLLLALFLDVYGVAGDGNYRFVTAFSAQATCLATTGPGLAGAHANCAMIPPPGKLVLIASMLLGRLEVFGVLAFMLPGTWRR